jgi:hypothetical protein
MIKKKNPYVLLFLVIFFACLTNPAYAADTTSGTLIGEPTYTRISTNNVDPNCNATSSFSASGVQYAVIPIHTTNGAGENLVATVNAAGTGINDTVMSVYCAFDPANSDQNLVAYDDDGGGGLMSAFLAGDGVFLAPETTYYVVLSLYSSGDLGSGTYQVDFGGDVLVGEYIISCVDSLSPTSASVGIAGVTDSTVDVDASEDTCDWTAEVVAPANTWITITSGSDYTGDDTVTYDVDANSGVGRSGSMLIAGRLFTVTQSGPSANYCDSSATNTTDEGIIRVQLNGGDQISDMSSGYSDYTGSVFTSLSPGSTYALTVTGQTTGGPWDECVRAWIDFNQDGDFGDSGETIDVGCHNFPDAGDYTFDPVSFTVPVGAADGNTRMRVSLRFNETPLACGVYTYGETEDYTVNILGCTYSLGSNSASVGESGVTGNTVSVDASEDTCT